jgi:hypothetical protein
MVVKVAPDSSARMAPLASLAALAVPVASRPAPAHASADPVDKAEPTLPLLSAASRPSTSSQADDIRATQWLPFTPARGEPYRHVAAPPAAKNELAKNQQHLKRS